MNREPTPEEVADDYRQYCEAVDRFVDETVTVEDVERKLAEILAERHEE